MEVKFKYGTWQKFQNIQKDPGTLYFLDNNQVYKGDQLLTSVLSVNEVTENTDSAGFPLLISDKLRNKFLISFITGEIRYIDDNLDYISITDLALGNILINQNFLQQLIAAIADSQYVEMPKLTVDGNKLVWTGSNIDSMTVFIPKQ